MSNAFTILMGIAMAAVLGVLIVGVLGFAKGGEFNKKHGNKLMRWRIGLQAVALTFFVLAMVSRQTSH
jgi:hypothetical protein